MPYSNMHIQYSMDTAVDNTRDFISVIYEFLGRKD